MAKTTASGQCSGKLSSPRVPLVLLKGLGHWARQRRQCEPNKVFGATTLQLAVRPDVVKIMAKRSKQKEFATRPGEEMDGL